MLALYDDERRMLFALSGLLAAAAFAIVPFAMPPQSLLAQAQTSAHASMFEVPATPAPLRFPTIDVARDPFLPDVAWTETRPERAGSIVVAGPTESAVLRAVVLGDDPHALVELNGRVQVMGIGDKLGTDTIAGIDRDGIALASGKRLSLSKAQP